MAKHYDLGRELDVGRNFVRELWRPSREDHADFETIVPNHAAVATKLTALGQQQNEGPWQTATFQQCKPRTVVGEYVHDTTEYAPAASIDAGR